MQHGIRATIAIAIGTVVVGTGASAGAAAAGTRSGAAKITVARKGAATALRLTVKPAARDHVARYSLSFGDGSRASKGTRVPGTVAHRYRAGRRYTATLTVTTARHRTITSHVLVAGPAVSPLPPADQWQDTGDPGVSRNQLLAVDVDHDGYDDLVGLDQAGAVSVVLGSGRGHFHPAPGSGTISATALAVGDVTGDGIPDLVTESEQSDFHGNVDSVLHVYAGNGTGRFFATSSLALSGQSHWNYTLWIAHLGGAGPTLVVDGDLYRTNGRGAILPGAQTISPSPSALVPVGGGRDALVGIDDQSDDNLFVFRADGHGRVVATPTSVDLGFGSGDWYGGGWALLGNRQLAVPVVTATMFGPAPTYRLEVVDVVAGKVTAATPLPSGIHLAGGPTAQAVDLNHDGIPDYVTAFGEVLVGHPDGTFTTDGRFGAGEWGVETAPTWDFASTLVVTDQVAVMLHGTDVVAFG